MGQIEFVTFHQSYSYEDFVEGLRPSTARVEPAAGDQTTVAPLGFSLEPRLGAFREISALAEQARRRGGTAPFDLDGRQVFKMSLGRAGTEDQIYDAAIKGNYIVLGWGGEEDWTDARYTNFEKVRERWNEIQPGTSGRDSNIAQLWAFRGSMREGDIVVVSEGNSRFRAVGEITGPYRYEPTGERDYNHRRDVRWLIKNESLPVDAIYSKTFMQRSCYQLGEVYLKREALARLLPGTDATASRPDQFVLVIDEINRANISKVFGELITLIEPDKRLGQPGALTVKLPYSGDAFGVPENLHIVGTMNTADRSIALLDTALRRRFRFRELMPDPSVLRRMGEPGGIDVAKLLTVINARIEYLFDREHQIGHAYFMGCVSREDVDRVMRDRVIPLLAEYFHEDWAKIALVLGDADGAGRFLERVLLSPPRSADDGAEPRYSWRVKAAFADDAYAFA
ncbi:MAG: AAA family ATPase [Bauldia sp.]|nr:AAA family ATPase [Bauldia sp.]